METENICVECGKELLGRSDRKFCCAECRTAFHNREYRRKNREILRINKILRKNHIILENALAHKRNICSTKYLYEEGFNFDYFTSLDVLHYGGMPKMVCYDLAYSEIGNGQIKIECPDNY